MDITEQEVESAFEKCGIIHYNINTESSWIQLRKDGETCSAIIVFFRPESVELAITLMDDYELKPKHVIRVERVTFDIEEKKEMGPLARKAEKKKLDAHIKRLNRQLDWDEAKYRIF